MEHMESRMQDQIEGAQSQNERLLVRADRLEKALTAIRKAAGGSRHFTNRLQFIYERAGVALADEEWDEEWKATHGYTMRTNILSENERLKSDVAQLQQRIAELEADKRRLDALEEAMKSGKHLNYHKRHFSLRGFTNYEYDVFKTVREAIDAAIAHKEGNQNG